MMSEIIEINLNTNEVVERNYTRQEKSNIKLMQDSFTPPDRTIDNSEEIKQSALDKLTALGLTEEEARTIVGI
jgi:hypothetical protein